MRKIPILFFIFFPLFVSCPYGIFDLLKPNNSTINAYINGKELYSTGYEGNIYKINIDENPHDYLVLIAQHYKDEVIRDFPFTWVSDTITFQTIGYNSNSIGVRITNKLEPGLHTITARSSVSDELSKTFKLYVVSETNSISAKYNISDDFVPLEGVDYTNLLSGEVTTSTRQISLMYGYRYIFSITQAEGNSMDNYTFSCTDNVNENGETVVYWDYNGMEYSLVVSSNVFDINHKPQATITHNQSNLSLSFSIDIKTIIGTDITEIEKDVSNDKYISLNVDDGQKSFKINFNNELPSSTVIYACLPIADDKELTDDYVLSNTDIVWADKHTFNAYYKKDTLPVTYFSLSFNGQERTFTISPYLNTVNQENRNINFYLYLKEENGTYLGKWKITVGGVIERIETNKQQINEKVNSSSSICATIYPENASGDVIWYLSETPYKSVVIDKKTIKKAPDITKDTILNNLVYMTGEEINNGSKTSIPLMNGNTSELLFSLGGINGKAYLIALAENTNDEIFKAIPVIVSANGEISIRSEVGVYSSITDSNGNILEFDKYSDENDTLLKLPDRAVQEYPHTAENGKYGPSVRTFYFPHNKESSVIISAVSSSEKIKWSSLPYRNEITDIREIKDGSVLKLIVTPLWFTHTKNALKDHSLTLPPQNKEDNNEESLAAYQHFEDYLGITYIDLSSDYNLNEVLCRIRIIIYDATVYSQQR